jgi:Tol biopolymer transport system component
MIKINRWVVFIIYSISLLTSVAALAAQGDTTRVSVDSAGVQSDGHSYDSSISSDGRYVAFDSAATNLVAGDTNGRSDIFVHDTQKGVTTRVSVDSAGGPGVAATPLTGNIDAAKSRYE